LQRYNPRSYAADGEEEIINRNDDNYKFPDADDVDKYYDGEYDVTYELVSCTVGVLASLPSPPS